jgi:hypothetical protein
MSPIFIWAGIAVCLSVVLACICRVNQLKAGRHREGWFVLYTAKAVFAFGVALDLVIRPDDVNWWVCAGVGAVMLQLFLTRNDWRHGAPMDLEKA